MRPRLRRTTTDAEIALQAKIAGATRMERSMKGIARALALAAWLPLLAHAASAQTLNTVKERGHLVCGVSEGLYGFSAPNADKTWSGFDVDLCRAVAGAIFNDASKVEYIPLAAQDRFNALKSGQIDLLSRDTTWTMSREVALGLMFAGVTYYDGQGFLVHPSLKAETALDLGGAKICVQKGTTTELNLADYFGSNNMKYESVSFVSAADALKAYVGGQCSVFTSDTSQLYASRVELADRDDEIILPDVISKEPLGPAVRQGDDQWLNIVKWTNYAMINAEELGVSSKNIDQALASDKPDIRRLVGADDNIGEQMGLTKDWAARIIRLVGNYGEVFEHNVGTESKLGIPRGLNNLWSNGGILYAPPVR
jgi:general L-amino acid transport system substrate-binding protein